MRECLERCVATSPWAIVLTALAAINLLNAAVRRPLRARPGHPVLGALAGLGRAAGAVLDRLSVLSNHEARGTLKLPGMASRHYPWSTGE